MDVTEWRSLTRPHCETEDELPLDYRTIFSQVEEVTSHISRIVFPAFSLDRGECCEIHENAFWNL